MKRKLVEFFELSLYRENGLEFVLTLLLLFITNFVVNKFCGRKTLLSLNFMSDLLTEMLLLRNFLNFVN